MYLQLMYLQSHIYKNIPVSFDFITTWNQGVFLCSPCILKYKTFVHFSKLIAQMWLRTLALCWWHLYNSLSNSAKVHSRKFRYEVCSTELITAFYNTLSTYLSFALIPLDERPCFPIVTESQQTYETSPSVPGLRAHEVRGLAVFPIFATRLPICFS